MPFRGDSAKFESGDGRNIALSDPLIFDSLERGATTTVPAGFQSDGASTPRLVWQIVPPFGAYWRGAVLHDWLYRETYLPREFCDGVFLEAMVSLGVSPVERTAIYDALRLFGGWAFQLDRLELEKRESGNRT